MIVSNKRCCLFRRRGQQDVAVKVEVEAEGAPELYTLSPELSELLGIQHGSRPHILHHLWQYIRTHKLQVCAPLLLFSIASSCMTYHCPLSLWAARVLHLPTPIGTGV